MSDRMNNRTWGPWVGVLIEASELLGAKALHIPYKYLSEDNKGESKFLTTNQTTGIRTVQKCILYLY